MFDSNEKYEYTKVSDWIWFKPGLSEKGIITNINKEKSGFTISKIIESVISESVIKYISRSDITMEIWDWYCYLKFQKNYKL